MGENLATELLRELKAQSKRWFIAFLVVLILWFATIGVFIWYVSLPTEEIEITNDSGIASYVGNDMSGDFNYGESESN